MVVVVIRTERLPAQYAAREFQLPAARDTTPFLYDEHLMHVPAGAGCQPRFDLRMFVIAIVVDDAVHVGSACVS